MTPVKALVFDVFGTVVDWRSTIIAEGEALARAKGIDVDWARFADDWRRAYVPSMDRVRHGEQPWTKLDDLHRASLDRLIDVYGLGLLSESERRDLNHVWHRLKPWPDSVGGLARLKTRYTIGTLSNGNVGLLTNMAKAAGLPWDVIFSAELVRHYKPDREAYQMPPHLLGLSAGEVMLVAAHNSDLQAAAGEGLRTAFVARPLEHGPGQTGDLTADSDYDFVARDFADLATQLNC